MGNSNSNTSNFLDNKSYKTDYSGIILKNKKTHEISIDQEVLGE